MEDLGLCLILIIVAIYGNQIMKKVDEFLEKNSD